MERHGRTLCCWYAIKQSHSERVDEDETRPVPQAGPTICPQMANGRASGCLAGFHGSDTGEVAPSVRAADGD
jgi:hypothetical protein